MIDTTDNMYTILNTHYNHTHNMPLDVIMCKVPNPTFRIFEAIRFF